MTKERMERSVEVAMVYDVRGEKGDHRNERGNEEVEAEVFPQDFPPSLVNQ